MRPVQPGLGARQRCGMPRDFRMASLFFGLAATQGTVREGDAGVRRPRRRSARMPARSAAPVEDLPFELDEIRRSHSGTTEGGGRTKLARNTGSARSSHLPSSAPNPISIQRSPKNAQGLMQLIRKPPRGSTSKPSRRGMLRGPPICAGSRFPQAMWRSSPPVQRCWYSQHHQQPPTRARARWPDQALLPRGTIPMTPRSPSVAELWRIRITAK
jgi:hypothetical protein